MIATKVELFDRQSLVDLVGLSPEESASTLADFARGAIAEVDASNADAQGATVPHTTFVDGSAVDDSLGGVRADSVIVARWDIGTDVVRWIFDEIVRASPVLTGAFKASQKIYADGVEVDSPEDAVAADEVVILSVLPYARKIEGANGRAPESPQAPRGVYQGVAALAAQRFGNIAKVTYGYRSPLGGGTPVAQWAASPSARHLAKRVHGGSEYGTAAWLSRQPAVIIVFR